MSWFSRLVGDGAPAAPSVEQARMEAWQAAIRSGQPPGFVVDRLRGAGREGAGVPWTSSMTPSELLLAGSHGFRPIGVVSGTCWFRYAWSWTEGHAAGWGAALRRMKAEAAAAGANAVVDAKMRTAHAPMDKSMDFTLLGTAVRIEGLPPSQEPVCATCPAFEFVRLVEAGVVPLGIAVGAYYDWLYDSGAFPTTRSQLGSWINQPLTQLTQFWENARRVAHSRLREDARRQGGSGVLADVQFGQLFRFEGDKAPDRYLGRHIVIGTVVHSRAGETVHAGVVPVLDLNDGKRAPGAPLGTARHPYRGDRIDSEGAI